MDKIKDLLSKVLDFFKNNETIAKIIDMIKGFLGKKEETAE